MVGNPSLAGGECLFSQRFFQNLLGKMQLKRDPQKVVAPLWRGCRNRARTAGQVPAHEVFWESTPVLGKDCRQIFQTRSWEGSPNYAENYRLK